MASKRFSLQLLSLLAFTAVAAAWALFILDKGGGLPNLGADTYEVTAVIPSGAALAPGSRVTAAGVHVGKVGEVERQGMGARVVLHIDDEQVTPLPSDSKVQVRQHTPVGENYISVAPGTATTKLESGAAIPVAQSEEFVDVDRVLSVMKGETRQRARDTIRSMGAALDGRGEKLNDLVGGASRFLVSSGQLVDTIHRDRRQASRLVDGLGNVAAAIGQRDAAIATIARQGTASLQAVRERDDALRSTIELLPETLRRARGTSNTLRSVSAVAAPVVDDAAVALRTLRPAVARLRPAAQDGRAVMRDLSATAPRLSALLDEVTSLSKPLPDALPKLRKTLCEATPVARYIKPYFPEVLHILMGLGSASNSYDATGHLIRLLPVLNENYFSGLPSGLQEATAKLLYNEATGTSLNYDAYPKPGDLGRTAARGNTPLGPERVPESGLKYPRVQADC